MRRFFQNPYNILITMLFMLLTTSILTASSINEIASGMVQIVKFPDILVTDYIEVAGISSAFFNSFIMGVFCLLLIKLTKHQLDEKTIMIIWLVCGFSFFGKNLCNSMPIVFGGYVYSKFNKEDFGNNLIYTLLGTGLSPIVSQVYFQNDKFQILGVFSGIIVGIIIGFSIIPISKSTAKFQGKYNLYNSGFAGGLLASLVMGIFRAIGINFEAVNLWSSGNNKIIFPFLIILSLFLIIAGILSGECKSNQCRIDKIKTFKNSMSDKNGHIHASYNEVKDHVYLNMGILGLFSSILMLLLNVELSGPVIGGIFTIIGFGCCGKHLKSIVPVMVGATFVGFFSIYGLSDPIVVICILFSTCLAPIATNYGVIWGTIAGSLHMTFVMNTGFMHGGMNLYNNGLAGGFVVIVLIPIIESFNQHITNKNLKT